MKPLRSGYRVSLDIGGPECESFERELEAYYGVPYARVFNSATSALIGATIAVGAKEVLVPCYSMSASATAPLLAGAKIKFGDATDDYWMDIEQERYRWDSCPDAAIVAHLFGHHGPTRQKCHPPVIIHDCAQSPMYMPLATYAFQEDADGGDLECALNEAWVYSLNQHKPIQCGEGGYALTFNREIAERLHLVRNHGECTSPDIIGYNFRMTEMQAAIARTEFRCLDERIQARRFWASEMQEKYDLPPDPGNIDWFLYPVRVKKNREEFAKRIPGARVGYHKLIPDLPWFKAHGYGGEFPNARLIESELVVIDPEAYGL